MDIKSLLINNRRICDHLHSILKPKSGMQYSKEITKFLTLQSTMHTCVYSSGLPEKLFMDVQIESTYMQEECKTYENAQHEQAVTHAFLL